MMVISALHEGIYGCLVLERELYFNLPPWGGQLVGSFSFRVPLIRFLPSIVSPLLLVIVQQVVKLILQTLVSQQFPFLYGLYDTLELPTYHSVIYLHSRLLGITASVSSTSMQSPISI
jgi:hypothetical protein